MKNASVHYVTRVVVEGDRTFIETRARALGSGTTGLPPGKVLVARTPILPPGASEEELSRATETRVLDDDGDPSWPCSRCSRRIPRGVEWIESGGP